jgi:hypothetical protein
MVKLKSPPGGSRIGLCKRRRPPANSNQVIRRRTTGRSSRTAIWTVRSLHWPCYAIFTNHNAYVAVDTDIHVPVS